MTWSRRPRPVVERLMEKVLVAESGCWEFTGYVRPNGYGMMSEGKGRAVQVHRLAYEIFHGPIPAEHDVDHTCFNPKCVNPAHLRALPHLINIRLTRRNLRATCVRGHPRTEENIYRARFNRRVCRPCHAIHERARRARLKAVA